MGAYNDLMQRARNDARAYCETNAAPPDDEMINSMADYITPANPTAFTELLTEDPMLWWTTICSIDDVELSPGKVLMVILFETLVDEMHDAVQEWLSVVEDWVEEDEEEDNG